MERHIERLTFVEVKRLIERGLDSVILPIGTVEAHGPHLPLGTDVMIPVSIAEKLADEVDSLIAPPVNYGITRSLLVYPGSLTVSSPAFKEYVKGILLSLSRHGFKKAVVINGHGGQMNELKEVGMEVWSETGLKTVMFNWWIALEQFTKDFFKQQGGHGAIDETAMIMAIDESLVKKEYYSEESAAVNTLGIDVYPFQAPIILYKKGEGLPIFDNRKANEYSKGVIEKTMAMVKDILAKWDKNQMEFEK
jgi:creatinine amidohydrolase